VHGSALESIQSLIAQVKVVLVEMAGLILFVAVLFRLLQQELRKCFKHKTKIR
jgi:hypothetical protein